MKNTFTASWKAEINAIHGQVKISKARVKDICEQKIKHSSCLHCTPGAIPVFVHQHYTFSKIKHEKGKLEVSIYAALW